MSQNKTFNDNINSNNNIH